MPPKNSPFGPTFARSQNAAHRLLGQRAFDLDREIAEFKKEKIAHEDAAAELRVNIARAEREAQEIAAAMLLLPAVVEEPAKEKAVRPVALHIVKPRAPKKPAQKLKE